MSVGTVATVEFTASSQRVKMVDMHPKESIVIAALYSGGINLYNYQTQALIRSFDTGTGLPVRCARFVPRLQSFVCGCDDMNVRVYNYNTMERTKMFQAHDDYIRSVAVNDQLPLVLTCADDMTVRQWDWSKGWALQMTYEGHQHFCMAIAFNPKDSSTFASASMDCTVKVWRINNPMPNFQLEGHEDGVNCVEFYPRGDKPYLLSGSDDRTVRLWDYQTKACLHVFSYHEDNVSCVLFHPDLPIIFSVSEADSIAAFSTETFRLLYTCNHTDMGRGWSLASKRHSNMLIAAFDNGMRAYKVGVDKPVFSMDVNGRVLVATGNEITRMDIKGVGQDVPDGEVLSVAIKDMGAVEATARAIQHAGNGQYICVLGDSDYTIISSLSLRPKSYGQCVSFVWGPESGSYAVLEGSTTLKIYKGFKERAALSLPGVADKLFAGPLLAVRTSNSIMFYDWGTIALIRQIDETPTTLEWSLTGELMALVTLTSVFLLKFNGDMVAEYLAQGNPTGDDGLDFSFDLVEELDEKVRDVAWVGDCLVYINQVHRLNYYIGGEVNNIAVLNRNQYLLGYLPKENRLFCIDKEKSITSYLLQVNVIEYMAAVVREDYEAANALLPTIDAGLRDKLSRFVESRGLLEMALEIATDDEHRFDLAVQLKRLPLAHSIASAVNVASYWKQVGDMALEQGFFDMAIEALEKCSDWSGLLLIYTSLNDLEAVSRLGDRCLDAGQANLAFTCYHLTERHAECVELLQRTGKTGDAAFYARTYCPAYIEDAVAKWKVSVATIPRVSQALANPATYPNLFPQLRNVTPPSSKPAAPPMHNDVRKWNEEERKAAPQDTPDVHSTASHPAKPHSASAEEECARSAVENHPDAVPVAASDAESPFGEHHPVESESAGLQDMDEEEDAWGK
ncbi:putative beta prime cop protein [Leptomonas seymouri]|uniref:Coatomer subunit beta' n=1 Tax=Leptomonas seymouri TaxID=5684 RepID=A0A0N1HWQ8_LEPSE|nr:putative beta prime cop protein [Leptomonas seymouri]|eukprot:KPI86581.1 putative beta prime cop protein [Leptomonas seymouri]